MLLSVLGLGVAAFFVVETIRILPLINKLTQRGVRPFACHICMSLWVALGFVIVGSDFQPWRELLPRWPEWFGIGGVCLAMLYFTDAAAASRPPELPR